MSTRLRSAVAVGALMTAPFGTSLAAELPASVVAPEAVEPAGADLDNVQFEDTVGVDAGSEMQETAELDNIQESSEIGE